MAEVTEKDYERMIWLHCVLEKMPEYCMYSKLYCAVGQEYEDRIPGMKHFIILCAWITGLGDQKTGNLMDHAILSIVSDVQYIFSICFIIMIQNFIS